MNTTLDLINAIDSGDTVDIEKSFEAIMSDKVSTKIDSLRQEIAQNMFKSKDVEEASE
jgi:hypothetical protein